MSFRYIIPSLLFLVDFHEKFETAKIFPFYNLLIFID